MASICRLLNERCAIAAFVLVALANLADAIAEPPFQPDAAADNWLARPQSAGEITAADREARQELAGFIDQKLTKEFRALAQVLLPEHSGVPANYDLLLYGRYLHATSSASVLRMRVRMATATAELLNDEEIIRGELPFREVDLLARQLALAYQSRIQAKNENVFLPLGFRSATHAPAYKLELVSRDVSTLYLRTDAEPLLYTRIDWSSQGAHRFIHNYVCNSLFQLAKRMKALPPNELRSAVADGLRRLRSDRLPGKYDPEPRPISDDQRNDLAAVQALLLSDLAVEHVVPEALPELRRLGFEQETKRLAIMAADDPLPHMATAILDGEWELWTWAIYKGAAIDSPASVAMFIGVISKVDEDRLGMILARLRNKELTREQTAIVVDRYHRAASQAAKLDLAEFLLNQTNDDPYYTFAMSLARRPRNADYDIDQLRRRAVDVVINYSARTKRRRDESYALLNDNLEQMPATARPDSFEYFSLVRHLGRIGTRDDLPRLEKLAENESGYLASSAIDAIVEFDPKLALRKARNRIEAFIGRAGDSTDFAWNVCHYFELVFWQGDRSFADPLRRARSLVSEEELEEHGGHFDPQPLIDYLEATGAPECASKQH